MIKEYSIHTFFTGFFTHVLIYSTHKRGLHCAGEVLLSSCAYTRQ